MGSFIDCHCHAFNVVDVPMYLTLTDKIKMGTLSRLKIAMGALLNIADEDLASNKIAEHMDFIQFFERSIERNIEGLLKDIRTYLKASSIMTDDSEILITPLVMDFDELLIKEAPDQAGKEPSVKEQYRRLKNAIDSSVIQGIPNARVCPFIGFDLRKLLREDDTLNNFKTFWGNNNTLGGNGIRNLESGKLLGIKLYPPIGFNPGPAPLPTGYEDFYSWCCDNDIPLTVHCQTGSYSVGLDEDEVDGFTTPENWKRLLEISDYNSLRINFAHFGGETGTNEMFKLYPLDEDSWTYILIKLLKKYPNTYADISAYDYSKEIHRNNLVKIFELDDKNEFEGEFKLADKLLWGSDVPMVVSGKSFKNNGMSSYKNYFQSFVDTIRLSESLSGAKQDVIIKKLTKENPIKFLRLQ